MSTREMMQTDLHADSASSCLDATLALCNACGRLCDAQIRLDQERVVLVKWCPEHGITRSLVSSDKSWYLRSLSYVKPGTRPLARAFDGCTACPGSCGLCPDHQQHTCVPIVEITGSCNLHCPICLVSGRVGKELTVEEVRSVLDHLIRYEGKINMLTLSGGEPTVHPELTGILDLCRRPEIGLVSVSTNGIALDRDPDLIRKIRDRDAVISLQFDGFAEEVYGSLRGRGDLAALKQRVVERILDAGARLSLTVTLGRGVNEAELPRILDLFFATDLVLSLMLQPLSYGASCDDPLNVLTIPDVVRLVAQASRGRLTRDDFTPLPCSHPSCFALTYLLKLDGGALVSLPSLIDVESYIDIIKNQALFGTDMQTLERIKDALYSLWSSDGMLPHRDAVLGRVKRLLNDISALGRAGSHRDLIDLGVSNVKSIFIHHFMDRATFDLSRAIKCCNHYAMPDGRLLPACVRNNLTAIGS
ncbi:MAG: radical SAM protein [Acidobacteriota bacterium]